MGKMKPLVLIIMDGFGIRKERKGNAIAAAKTPNLDKYFKENPFSLLKASGEPVGLPKGFQGSSEVGHLNMGAGRIVEQEEVRINNSIKDETFFKKKSFLKAIKNAKINKTNLHIMGLLQDQGVHSHQDHLFALLKLCHQEKIVPLLHIFTDGRDTMPKSANKFFKQLETVMEKYPAEIKTIMGRYYAMDRDHRWKRTKLAYDALMYGKGVIVRSWKQALREAYNKDETDEFIRPKIIGKYFGVKKNDSLIFFNYRSDRTRQLTQSFIEKKFNFFKRDFKKVLFVGMAEYYKDMPAKIAFEKDRLKNVLAEVLSRRNKRQLKVAETEKYAHVTFFFNDEIEKPFDGEDRILIPSPRIPTYDSQPEMSAYKITKAVLKEIKKDMYDVIIINFANCDMVGHTGVFRSTVKAVEVVDDCIGQVVSKVLEYDGTIILTADHGNAELMVDDKKNIITSHTTNRVPFCVINSEFSRVKNGKLGDIAPTILRILDLNIPKEMTGEELFY